MDLGSLEFLTEQEAGQLAAVAALFTGVAGSIGLAAAINGIGKAFG